MQYRIERVGIHLLAFLVARCRTFGMCPFVVPFFMAAYLQERSSVSLFAALLFGVISNMEITEAFKCALALIFLLVMLNSTDRKKIFSDKYQIALAAGVILCSISLPYEYVVTGNDISFVYSFLEGLIACCFTLVFEQAFEGFKAGAGRMFGNNERFIGIFICITAALFGFPVIEEPFNSLFAVCSVLLMYYSYQFGGGIGVAAGSATGLVLAFKLNEVSFLAVMIIMATIMALLRELGKAGIMLAYLSCNILLGILYQDMLLSPVFLGTMLLSLAIFFFIPSALLKREIFMDDAFTSSGDFLVQEATKTRIENFGQAFIAMEKMLETHEEERATMIPNGLSNMYLSGDGISLLNAVESQSNRLSDMRKNFIKQLGRIGEIITSFQSEIAENSLRVDYFESRVKDRLSRLGIRTIKAVPMEGKNGHLEVYISCAAKSEVVVTGNALEKPIGRVLGRPVVCVGKGENVIGKQEELFVFTEKGKYMLTTGVVRKKRTGEQFCGDNFSITKLDTQKTVLMISDGMGFGEAAHLKSGQVVELLEQLLMAGFCRDLAVELLNSFISFLAEGNISSTLDLAMIDFYTGDVDFIKLGASTTFIKRADTVECIRSASLPVGILEQVEFDTCNRKLYHGDMIVMVSDGILDGIMFENKETYLANLIGRIDTKNVQIMAEAILEDVEKMRKGNMRDDSTVLVAGLWERRERLYRD